MPSPFAATLAHDQLNRYVYADDQPEGGGRASSLSDELIAHALRDAALRPEIELDVVVKFESKLQRREIGYAPATEAELVEWVKERVWVREIEWFEDLPVPDGIERVVRGDRVWFAHSSALRLVESDLTTAIANALQFYGPHALSEWHTMLPLTHDEIANAFDDLISTDALVEDVVVDGCSGLCVCDSRNLAALLRFQRHHNRPTVTAKPVRALPGFLASWHRFGRELTEATTLDVLEQLQGFSAPVRLWLDALWRPRVGSNEITMLSGICERFDVSWYGTGSQRITLGIERQRVSPATEDEELAPIFDAFRDPLGSYTYLQLQQASQLTHEEFNRRFWQAVWSGALTSDAISALAHADESDYSVQGATFVQVQRSRRRLRSRAQVDRPLGTWRRVTPATESADELERFEDEKEHVRILTGRYGVLCRELCNREGGKYRWAQLFRAMRAMELSGELVSGLFFEELSGPQFLPPSALDTFLNDSTQQDAFWINSYDPVSPCGLGLAWPGLPSRQLGNMLAFNQGELILTSRSFGKHLDFLVSPDDDRLDGVLKSMHHAVGKRRRITIDKINGERALDSDYLTPLGRHMNIRRGVRDVFVESMIR